jgi:hypothetical protein
MNCYLYRHFNKEGALLYVGVSLNALNRLAQHRDVSHWFPAITNVTIEIFPDRKAALAAEQKAIIKENPRHNLHRYTAKELKAVKTKLKTAADASRQELVSKLVYFKPVYSSREAAEVLKLGVTAIKRLIAAGDIGSVEIRPGRKFITGWQMIEFIEAYGGSVAGRIQRAAQGSRCRGSRSGDGHGQPDHSDEPGAAQRQDAEGFNLRRVCGGRRVLQQGCEDGQAHRRQDHRRGRPAQPVAEVR